MTGSRAAKRQEVVETFASHFPRPIAELVAAVAHPFDDADGLEEATLQAHKVARRQVRELFAHEDSLPSGGEIEARLCEIARGLLDTLERDRAAAPAARRVSNALSHLGDVTLTSSHAAASELVAPESARRLDTSVPFAMWR
jgi:hypothetical protein